MYSRSTYNTVFVGVHLCIVVDTKKILATAYVLCLYTRVYLRLYTMGDAITCECSIELNNSRGVYSRAAFMLTVVAIIAATIQMRRLFEVRRLTK